MAMRANQLDTTNELATRALELARDSGDSAACGGSLALLAMIQWHNGSLQTAYATACNACGLLCAAPHAGWLLRAYNVRATLHAACGDEHAAVEIWRHALTSKNTASAGQTRNSVVYNLTLMLLRHGEYEEAIQCLSPSITDAAKSPNLGDEHTFAASALAYVHSEYAQSLIRGGRTREAQTQLSCSAGMLPPLDPFRWRSFSTLKVQSLWCQLATLSVLGKVARARSTAAAAFMLARQRPRVQRFHAGALTFAALVHGASGNLRRAIHFNRRALVLWRALDDQHEASRVMNKLASLHADNGEHAQALALRRELIASVAADQARRSAMSRRLAVIEREVEAQLADARERISHAQQLSIIGRLIGQIHHALQAPIQLTRQLCVLALRAHERAAAIGAPAPGIPALLMAISQSVDEAANLSRQLKIYAYRSSPAATVVSIDTSLREVWATLNPHVSAHPRELRVVGDTSLHVRADPQRLGVLLTLMLIELVKKRSSSAAMVVVTANIEVAAPSNVALVMDSELPRDVRNEEGSTVSLIETLCKEIAGEMGATLSCTHPGGTLLRCTLVMPNADTGATDRNR